ncbi:MAG: orotidine-5'-phosphate decarboxylase [Chloroflexi bacterium]|nr:orotidine-5'-phosphate decarboxylase [Chloroflexota bacterium]
MTSFVERLDAACGKNGSLLCVGLDPEPTLMPVEDIFSFNREIVDATRDLVCAYKPNLGFYEAHGIPGLQALQKTVEHIRAVAPDVIILGDAKRGDIANTAQKYAHAMFEVWGFDAVTVNPYGGHDAVQPFLDYKDKGTFVLCRTSNPGAGELQDRLLVSESGDKRHTLYEAVALEASGWNRYGNVGLVLGATYPQQLSEVRRLCPEMPFLVPGIGAQEGSLEASVRGGVDANGRRAIISSSRGVLYASRNADFAEAARKAAQNLRDAINRILSTEGHEWP